jgi:zinc protease
MSTAKKAPKKIAVPGFSFVRCEKGISEFVLKTNGLRVLHHERKGTGVVTTNITYFVGSRDESRGETGSAHMLEHMLFKPTIHDMKRGDDQGESMRFETETGCIINANTWKDRTTYYYSYPKSYTERAIKIESERMNGVVLTDESLAPERNNVLSEYDMYNGDPYFALSVAMAGAAIHSHTYGHETIGHREDIESYNASILDNFYKRYYRPDNAILMIVGDIDEKTALTLVKKYFTTTPKPHDLIPRLNLNEPKQEGLRRTSVERPSEMNIVSLGIKHPGFPSNDWYTVSCLFDVLTTGPESVLHRALVDTGLASSVEGSLEPTKEENLGSITITLAKDVTHANIEEKVLSIIRELNTKTITPLLKNIKARMLTDELFARDNSLRIVAELTEYASAGDWTYFNKTPDIINSITPVMVQKAAGDYFKSKNMTIGYFIGTGS